MKARYLTYFSYIGTKFRSTEKLWIKEGRNYPDPESVQGLMELALLKVKPVNYPNLMLSSRTDGGVHALNSSAHFDLERRGEEIYNVNFITYQMNKFFFSNDITISVRKCLRVNDNFSARFNATSRTYLYRLAVLKPKFQTEENTTLSSFIPIEEWRRCHFIRNREFDIERFKEGAKYFVGYHDFTTFKKFDKLLQNKHNRRELKSITISPGGPCATTYTTNNRESCFNYWDIEIKGKSFVHNQEFSHLEPILATASASAAHAYHKHALSSRLNQYVKFPLNRTPRKIRRMIGTLISVSIGKLEPEDVKVMLQIPSKHSWHSFISTCPPDGLYLCNVDYNPEDLVYDPDKSKTGVNDNEEDESE